MIVDADMPPADFSNFLLLKHSRHQGDAVLYILWLPYLRYTNMF